MKSKRIELSLPPLPEIEREIERRRLCRSHLAFTERFFEEAQGQSFSVGPHHALMCETFDKVYRGEIRRLIVNVPPGYSKTELGVINFMAHGFAINPQARFIHASYAQTLALDNSAKARDVINLAGYQKLWPVTLKADTSAKGLWRTTQGGHVRAAASGEPITGFRAGRLLEAGEAWKFTGALIIDDPLKPDDATSDTTRKFINARWQNTFKSRLGDENVAVIVIMQRLHIDDFVSHLLETSGEQWNVLKLPIRIEGECEQIHPKAVMVPHGLPNGPLWVQKHSEEQISILELSPQVFAGQYMQEPIASGGNLFKLDSFGRYHDLPKLVWRALYADTAQKTAERNDFTVFEHWGQGVDGKAYLIDVVRARFEAPELEATAKMLWDAYRLVDPNKYGSLRKMVIEDKASGTGLIQSLARKAIPVIAMQREKDKYTRALDIVPACASGLVVLPKDAPWLKTFEAEVAAFPDGSFDDQVDPMIDAVLEMCGNIGMTLQNL